MIKMLAGDRLFSKRWPHHQRSRVTAARSAAAEGSHARRLDWLRSSSTDFGRDDPEPVEGSLAALQAL
jgi:hypothetical protein